MSEIADQIIINIYSENYQKAYYIGNDALKNSDFDREQIIAALCELTARLRSVCMSLAMQKMDRGERYEVIENLLRKVNELTGQDMYGIFVNKIK